MINRGPLILVSCSIFLPSTMLPARSQCHLNLPSIGLRPSSRNFGRRGTLRCGLTGSRHQSKASDELARCHSQRRSQVVDHFDSCSGLLQVERV